MVGSMSLPRTNPQPEQYSEFALGKEETGYTLYDQMNEGNLKDKEKDVMIDAYENNQSSSRCLQREGLASTDRTQG
jgi:hypothetical protein